MAITRGIPTDELHQARVIIIDDEPDAVRILVEALKCEGFSNIHSTTDPRLAIELCQSYDPDLVILDLTMPEVNGLEVLSGIRTRLPAENYLPVLIMTGDTRAETKRTALAFGANDFIVKPFDHIEFLLRTTILLEMRLLHQGLSSQKCELEKTVRERTTELEEEINEHRQAAELLRQSEEKYRDLFEHAAFGMFQVTPDGKVLAANSAAARLCGYASPEDLMTSTTDAFNQFCADPERVQEFRRLMHEEGNVTNFEGPIYRKDGTPMWISTSARTVCSSKGEVLYYEGTIEDISARKKAEAVLASTNQELEARVRLRTDELSRANEELRASHSRLDAVLSATPVILWATNRAGRFTFAAGKCWSLLEQERERVIGTSVFALYGDIPQIAANHQRVLQGEIVESTVTINGLVFDARHVPLRNSTGEVKGMLGVAVDITARKHAEDALRGQKELLQTIFNHLPVMISLYDENGKVRLVNREWEQVLGWSTKEIQTEPDIWAQFYPEAEEYQRLLKFVKTPAGEWMDFKTRVRDGRVVDTAWTNVRLSDGTRIGLGLDITTRKRAERELQARLRQQAAVAEFGQDALAGTEFDVLLSHAATLVTQTLETEYSVIAELLPDRELLVFRAGAGWKEGLVGHATVPSDRTTLAGYALLSREPVVVEDLRTETRFSGPSLLNEHGIVSSMSVIIGSPERPFGVLCTHTRHPRPFTQDDVNFLQTVANVLALVIERSQADRTVRAAKEEADRANRAKSEFLSRMSHELRTPLNAILGFAQLLELEEQFTGEIRDNVEQIIKGGRHLLELINEVLDIARIEAGKFALSVEAVDARETITEALRLIAPLAGRYSIQLDSVLETNDVYFLADRQRIRQVLLNLLSNAIKYNHEFGLVRVSCKQNDRGWVRIEVCDTGNGIAPENLSKLFTPFERLGIDQRDVEGAGIGLALSKRLIELMDGSIGVESIIGEGSVFWIELPAAEDPLARVEVTGHSALCPVPQCHQHTILHIEDNLSNLKLIERILSRRPEVHLLAAIQGELGLQLAREHRPDLILLDVHLPDIDGSEVLRRLGTDDVTREIPVVMLSADATPGQIQRLLAAGARKYLTKPLDVPTFLTVLKELLGDQKEEH